MIPGPDKIKECTECKRDFKEASVESGNTFGATYWTDGKREAPMLPDQEWLLICPHCSAGLWSDELDVIAELNVLFGHADYSDDEEYSNTPYAKTPSINDFHQTLISQTLDNEKTQYLRVKIWWTGNDVRRENPDGAAMTALEIDNLVALIPMLTQGDADDQSLIMKAEALRELGRFDDALLVLDKITDRQLAKAVDQVRQLAMDKDWVVRQLF